ncbi:von Willebrand factor type D domain [Popillia japonica]|uniref:von Willebrand factor type D domain n=1 Tax=Popillia japonica TaxID=7064 RepID=A0AAW1LMD1_POPJA
MIFLLLTLTVTSLICSPVDSNVYVNKCCKFNEVLVRDELVCKAVNTTINWKEKYLTFKETPGTNELLQGLPANWKLQEKIRPNCEYSQYLQRMHSFVGFENGSMYVSELGETKDPSSFCLDVNIVLVRLRIQSGVRVNRCCGKHAAYSEIKRSCEHNSTDNRTISVPQDTVVYERFPNCSSLVLAGKLADSKILEDGSLELSVSKTVLPQDGYCLEFIKENSDDSASIFACKQYIADAVATKIEPDIRFTLYPIALMFSVIFLAATLIAGFLLPASHHVLHWRCQTNHVLCLLLGDIFLCIVQFSGHKIQGLTCTMMAVAMHFLFLAAFFWLNTMCFNIWWTFSVCKGGQWKCIKGQCDIWGDSHVKTFDGVRYDFQGDCSYTLVEGQVGFDKISVSFKKTKLPNTKHLRRIIVTDHYLFTTIKIYDAGVDIFWDKNTWVYVKLDEAWQNRIKGLCGNFNCNKHDDLDGGQPTEGPHNPVMAYVDRWKTEAEYHLEYVNKLLGTH